MTTKIFIHTDTHTHTIILPEQHNVIIITEAYCWCEQRSMLQSVNGTLYSQTSDHVPLKLHFLSAYVDVTARKKHYSFH